LPDVPRTDAGRAHLGGGYRSIDDLWSNRLDGLIVTGTEPRAPSLMDEPYWGSLVKVLEWAQEHTASTVWSCLAAHAAVLHIDGIRRQALDEKCFGIFECASVSDHPLMAGVPARVRIPHSRCNELPEQALRSCGYTILTRSPEAGVDAFVKQRKSLFVYFQGHPEYDERALLREYRRDIGRFLRGERETYPILPRGYFDDVAADVLAAFRNEAQRDRREALLDRLPAGFLEARLNPMARPAVTRLYGNWLSYLSAQKEQRQVSSRGQLRSRHAVAPQPVQGMG
jgi:homoserine O-succinyltransferase